MNFQQEKAAETLRSYCSKTPKPITLEVYKLIELSKDKIKFWQMIKDNGWLNEPTASDKTQYMRYGFIHFWYRREILNEYIPDKTESDPFPDEPKKEKSRQIKLL